MYCQAIQVFKIYFNLPSGFFYRKYSGHSAGCRCVSVDGPEDGLLSVPGGVYCTSQRDRDSRVRHSLLLPMDLQQEHSLPGQTLQVHSAMLSGTKCFSDVWSIKDESLSVM